MRFEYFPDADGGFLAIEGIDTRECRQICDFRDGMGEKYGDQIADLLTQAESNREDFAIFLKKARTDAAIQFAAALLRTPMYQRFEDDRATTVANEAVKFADALIRRLMRPINK